MRPNENDEPDAYQGQSGGREPRQEPIPPHDREGRPPQNQQPPRRARRQGPPQDAGPMQSPPPMQSPREGPTGSQPPPGPPQRDIPPQQWHEPPTPPRSPEPQSQPPGRQQASAPPGARSRQPEAMTEARPGPGSTTGAPQAGARPPPESYVERVRLEPFTVDDVVVTDVVTAERDTSLVDVVAEMSEEDVGSVVVVEDDAPVGILTDRTIAMSLESEPDVSDRTADDLVPESLVTGTTDMSVFDALHRLRDEGVRRLPIVDEDGTLEGIVTLDDVLVLLAEELGNATEIIRRQSPRL